MADESEMTLLKKLLMSRHLETHRAFRLEYDKVARKLDKRLIASAPGREQYGRWLAGQVKTKPSADRCRVLEHMFPGRTVAELLSPYDPEKGTSVIPETPSDVEEETATNRRQIFQLGAATMASGLIDSVTHGPDLFEQVLDSTSVGEGRLSQMEAEAERLGVQVVHVPPVSILPEALLHFSTVRELLKHRQPAITQHRLTRIGAMLAIVVGEILFCSNQSLLARRWWLVAERAAEEAGDRYLADMALASSAYVPTYSGDPQGTLARVMPRLESATRSTPAIAWMWGFVALAHASLGNRDDFERAINNSRNTLTRCDPSTLSSGVFSFLPKKQAFYETRGRADLGDVNGAAESANRALAAYEDTSTTDPALVRLAYASALARSGQLDEACHLALAAISDPNIVPASTVVVRAYEFDAFVDQRTSAAVEWRLALRQLRVIDATGSPAASSYLGA